MGKFSSGTVITSTWLNDVDVQTYNNVLNVKSAAYGAVGDGVTDDTTAINAAIAAAVAAGGGTVFFPPGTYNTTGVMAPKSNVTLRGLKDASWIKLTQPGTNITTGFYAASGFGTIENFHVRDLSFDGQRGASPANVSNHIFNFQLGATDVLRNVTWENCDFKNAQEDCIRINCATKGGTATRVAVRKCDAWTDDASLFESTNKPTTDLIRIEQSYDYATGGNGYGDVNFTHIEVSGCYAEKIRTLADLKRGCEFFIIANNRTKNMYDCHHSVDGSFQGVIRGNVGQVESTTTIGGTFTNFIEVQGEHVLIEGNTCDAGGKLISGIMVTAYGRTQESGKGHRSVKVIVRGNTIKNNTTNAYRILDGYGCAIVDNDVESCGVHTASIEAGTYTDGANPLYPIGNVISGIKSKSAGAGVSIASTAVGTIYGPCFDENGQDFYDLPTNPGPATTIVNANTYANFVNQNGYTNLMANPWFEWSGTGTTNATYWTGSYPALTAAASTPNGAPRAVTITDSDAVNMTTLRNATTISLTQNQRIYCRVEANKNTATQWSIFVQELDAGGAFLANYFYGTSSPAAAWTPYTFRHTAVNANCAKVQILVAPAAAFSTGVTTGTTDFANLRVSRLAIGSM